MGRRMRLGFAFFAWLGGITFTAATARADFILYALPSGKSAIALEGTILPGGPNTIRFRHDLGMLVFKKSELVKRIERPSIQKSLRAKIISAHRKRDVDRTFRLAVETLRRGHVTDFVATMKRIQEIDPEFAPAKDVLELKEKMDREIPETEDEIRKARELVDVPGMKIARSRHFLLIHDTPTHSSGRRLEQTLADKRLELLEKVYSTFLFYFAARGIMLEVPKERLVQALFFDKEDFDLVGNEFGPGTRMSAGFYVDSNNVAYFFHHGSTEGMKAWTELAEAFIKLKSEFTREEKARTNYAEYAHFADTFSLLGEMLKESSDIESVSHETAHQLAANTGLQPRMSPIPIWAAEGLATFFESPRDAVWAGVGAVNEQRLSFYRAMMKDPERGSLNALVSDRIFTQGKTFGDALHGYAQSWALTHFLFEKHFDELLSYYRLFATYPRSTGKAIRQLKEDEKLALFDKAFKVRRGALETEWRRYMRGLRTDLEAALEEEAERERDDN